VIALVAARGQPRAADLVRLSELARDRSQGSGGGSTGDTRWGSGTREQAGRVLEVSMGALNTLAAVSAFGGGEQGARFSPAPSPLTPHPTLFSPILTAPTPPSRGPPGLIWSSLTDVPAPFDEQTLPSLWSSSSLPRLSGARTAEL
jgi:hypothetical protein